MKKSYKMNNNMKQAGACIYILILTIGCCFSSCKKYLDIKPDKKLQLPSTLDDCQALLADYNTMNGGYPAEGEAASDNYYLTVANWNSLSLIDREGYIWKADANVNYGRWSGSYLRILNANQVLETLSKINPGENDKVRWNTLKGAALFFRAFSFFQLAQIWTKPYDSATAAHDLGIPIRLTPDLNEKTDRGTVQQVYNRILEDLKNAVELLPATLPVNAVTKATLLTKTAAFAALARVYLSMSDYTDAATNANNCLQQYNVLLDYNELNAAAGNPIAQFNAEVIFDAMSASSIPLYNAKVDTTLYASYDDNDLRKVVFFRKNGNGGYAFKGGYAGTPSYSLFCGLATDEMYLIRAECYARAGNITAAMDDLNMLMQKRWKGTFEPFTATDPTSALTLILQERRKELLFRGIRWTDLRRLNREKRFAITLKRNLDDQEYVLPPNDPRYVLLIPTEVLSRVNIPQNPR